MDKKRIVTYSLLAHINNHSKGIQDFNDIFLPLIQRTLSKLCKEGVTKGLLNDIKQEIDNIYALDIPFPLLKKNLNKIAHLHNTSAEKEFQVFGDGSFVLHKYLFLEYEEIVSQQEADIESVNLAYGRFLEINSLDKKTQPSLFEFLDKHRISLSNFFADKNDAIIDDIKYINQADFINEIKGVKELFDILKRIYLGSIISSYLEVDFGYDTTNKLEFILDTTFIISLLDLHSFEAKHTCEKILEICKRLGYKLFVLADTIQESSWLLGKTAEHFNEQFLAQKVDVNSIYNACERRGLNKTDLERISLNLEKIIYEHEILIVANTEKFRNIALYSKEYETLKLRKSNPDGALHDAIAIKYVQTKRGNKKSKSFYEGKCYFVTDMKKDLYNDGKYERSSISESIRADELVNILWLTNPNVKTNEINEIGLTRLVSSTINSSLPNPRVLKELDDNIQKYAQGKVEVSDCHRVANMIANRTITNLTQLNKSANKNPDEFVLKLKELAARSKKDEIRKEKLREELIGNIHEEFEKKFLERDALMKHQFDSEMDKAISQLANAKDSELEELNKTRKLELIKSKISERNILIDQVRNMELAKNNCNKHSKIYTRNALVIIISALVFIYFILWYILKNGNWDDLEKWTYFLSSPILFYILYFITTVIFPVMEFTLNPMKIRTSIERWHFQKVSSKWNFSDDGLSKLVIKLGDLNLQIQEIENEI